MKLYFDGLFKSDVLPTPEHFNADYVQFKIDDNIYVFDTTGWTEWDYDCRNENCVYITGRTKGFELLKIILPDGTEECPSMNENEIRELFYRKPSELELGYFIDDDILNFSEYNFTFSVCGKEFTFNSMQSRA